MTDYVYFRIFGYLTTIVMHVTNIYFMMKGLKEEHFEDPYLKIFSSLQSRYFTCWTFTIQIIYAVIGLACDSLTLRNSDDRNYKLPKHLKGCRDTMFAGVLWPSTWLVFTVFWPLFLYNRDLIFPKAADKVLSRVSNHVIHTAIVPVVIWEVVFRPRVEPKSHIRNLLHLLFHISLYFLVLAYTYLERGIWIYPILTRAFGTIYFPIIYRGLHKLGTFIVQQTCPATAYLFYASYDSSLKKRYESTMTSLTKDEILVLLRPPFTNWSNIIREAEKVVGYPTSFMNLRCLLSDEFANLALYLRKLVGSNHLVMQTAKNVLYGDSNNLQPWGLIILLLSKSVKTCVPASQTKVIDEQQRALAELIELMRTGHLIHRGIVNVPFAKRSKSTESAIFGNKIAILLGDYLLVTANTMLAGLKNADVLYTVSLGLKNLSEGEFFGDRDEQNMPLPGKPKSETDDIVTFDATSIATDDVLGKSRKEWTARTVFNGVSLLGRACQSAMLLAKQEREMQNYAYHFGCHVGLAWQAATELQSLTSESKDQFCLASAPVLFALEDNPDLYKIIHQAKNDVKDVDYEDLKFNILKTDAVEKTKMLYKEHANKATTYIESIGCNESVAMIRKLINTF
ncbi:unnamed protein product, partial [Iphiclides podalirius]